MPSLSLVVVLVCLLMGSPPTTAPPAQGHSIVPAKSSKALAGVSRKRALVTVRAAADSLIARHRSMPQGGWAWRSAVQAPHYQTDRDVGAAGIGDGLLAAYRATGKARYKRAAVHAGDFLLGVAERTPHGLRWPDWADPNGQRSATHYTSFDDGAAGISDFLWQLSAATGKQRFRVASLEGMRWVAWQARGSACPKTSCTWAWTDDRHPVTYHGVGMGEAGIVLAFDTFADRTGNPTWRAYARAGAAHLRELTANGTRPLPRSDRDSTHETGFLSGSAGAAYMFLRRYDREHRPADLQAARGLLVWVRGQAVRDSSGGLSWPMSAGSEAFASGFQLGAAGIAWVYLKAYQTTGSPGYRDSAARAGRWLRSGMRPGGTWAELPGDATVPVHLGLDSGGAGIGWVLSDLARAGIEPAANAAAARAALTGVRKAASKDRRGALWYSQRTSSGKQHRAEPSWHWGSAGVAAFGARLAGSPGASPAGSSGL